MDAFLEFLSEGSSAEVDDFYSDVKYERIAILYALGAHLTHLAKMEPKHADRDRRFIDAVAQYTKASRIDHLDPTPWTGRGSALLAKWTLEKQSRVLKSEEQSKLELKHAHDAFGFGMDEEHDYVPGLLGQASVHFHSGRYQEALKLYKRALRLNPGGPAVMRLGIGYCHWRLQSINASRHAVHALKARQAFERVLQLESDNVEALVALGMLDLQSEAGDDRRRGLQRMQAAFQAYPYCVQALNQLASHYFFTGQHAMVEQLMEAALAASDNSATKAESYYHLARSLHKKGDYEKAFAYYRAATQEVKDPKDFILPFYGLGQMHLRRGESTAALESFNTVLQFEPDNLDALKVVGSIYAQQGLDEQALANFKRVMELEPKAIDAWLETGELMVKSDFGAALKAFQRARELLQSRNRPVPSALLNNIGVLLYEHHEYQQARDAYLEALGPGPWTAATTGPTSSDRAEEKEDSSHSEEVPPEKVTTIFNLARLHEKSHDLEQAQKLYRMILSKYPKYVDCYLRLGVIAFASKQIVECLRLIGDTLRLDENNLNALSLRAMVEMERGEWMQSKDTLKRILKLTNNDDAHATVALGNWNYYTALREGKHGPDHLLLHLGKAQEYYHKVLVRNPGNIYAANGLACIFAERDQIDLAKELLTQVQEAAAGSKELEMPEVWVNLAHCHLAKGDHTLAIKMYEKCMQTFHREGDTALLLFLARAFYDSEQWGKCRKALQKGLHAAPHYHTLRFNIAVVIQKFATTALQSTTRSAQQVRDAVGEVKIAMRLFSQLAELGSQHAHGFDQKKIDTHIDYCKHLLEASKVHLEAAEREEQQQKQRVELARQQALAEEARRQREADRKLEEARARKEELERLAVEQEQRMEAVKGEWQRHKARLLDTKDEKSDEEKVDGEEQSDKKEKRRRRRSKKDKQARSEGRSMWEDEEDEEGATVTALYDSDEGAAPREEGPEPRKERPKTEANGAQDPAEDIEREGTDALAAAGLLDDYDDDNDRTPEGGSGLAHKRRKRGRVVDQDSDQEDEHNNETQGDGERSNIGEEG
eukprot:SM000156S02119  [mRNA]  locus=s156:71480:78136:+ [translate_table: standard]